MLYEGLSGATTVATTTAATAAAAVARGENIFGSNYSSISTAFTTATTTTTTIASTRIASGFMANTTDKLLNGLNGTMTTTKQSMMHEIIGNFSSTPLHLLDDNKSQTVDMNQLSSTIMIVASTASTDIKMDAMSLRRTCLVAFFTVVILITIFGNTLVILSVTTTRRLRTVTNCFVMSLALADWMVGVFVMPPAVLLYISGKLRPNQTMLHETRA